MQAKSQNPNELLKFNSKKRKTDVPERLPNLN